MRLLLDEQLPHKLRPAIVEHEVFTVRYMGWDDCRNGELLRRAEEQFDVFVTADQNLTHQQRVRGRHLAILVLLVTDMRLPTAATRAEHLDGAAYYSGR